MAEPTLTEEVTTSSPAHVVPHDDQPQELHPCTICGRTFLPNPLRKHYTVCQRNATRKRRIFNSLKQRVEGTDLAPFHQRSYVKRHDSVSGGAGGTAGVGVPSPVAPLMTVVNSTNSATAAGRRDTRPNKWKEKHMELMDTIRTAREMSMDTVVTAPVVTSPNQKSSALSMTGGAGERCPSCDRHFGPKAFDRHVEWCREHKARVNKSLNADVQVAKERLDARIKYRVPPLAKAKRSTIKDKYAPTAKQAMVTAATATLESTSGALLVKSSTHVETPKTAPLVTSSKSTGRLRESKPSTMAPLRAISNRQAVDVDEKVTSVKRRETSNEPMKSSRPKHPLVTPHSKLNKVEINSAVDEMTVSSVDKSFFKTLQNKTMITWKDTLTSPTASKNVITARNTPRKVKAIPGKTVQKKEVHITYSPRDKKYEIVVTNLDHATARDEVVVQCAANEYQTGDLGNYEKDDQCTNNYIENQQQAPRKYSTIHRRQTTTRNLETEPTLLNNEKMQNSSRLSHELISLPPNELNTAFSSVPKVKNSPKLAHQENCKNEYHPQKEVISPRQIVSTKPDYQSHKNVLSPVQIEAISLAKKIISPRSKNTYTSPRVVEYFDDAQSAGDYKPEKERSYNIEDFYYNTDGTSLKARYNVKRKMMNNQTIVERLDLEENKNNNNDCIPNITSPRNVISNMIDDVVEDSFNYDNNMPELETIHSKDPSMINKSSMVKSGDLMEELTWNDEVPIPKQNNNTSPREKLIYMIDNSTMMESFDFGDTGDPIKSCNSSPRKKFKSHNKNTSIVEVERLDLNLSSSYKTGSEANENVRNFLLSKEICTKNVHQLSPRNVKEDHLEPKLYYDREREVSPIKNRNIKTLSPRSITCKPKDCVTSPRKQMNDGNMQSFEEVSYSRIPKWRKGQPDTVAIAGKQLVINREVDYFSKFSATPILSPRREQDFNNCLVVSSPENNYGYSKKKSPRRKVNDSDDNDSLSPKNTFTKNMSKILSPRSNNVEPFSQIYMDTNIIPSPPQVNHINSNSSSSSPRIAKYFRDPRLSPTTQNSPKNYFKILSPRDQYAAFKNHLLCDNDSLDDRRDSELRDLFCATPRSTGNLESIYGLEMDEYSDALSKARIMQGLRKCSSEISVLKKDYSAHSCNSETDINLSKYISVDNCQIKPEYYTEPQSSDDILAIAGEQFVSLLKNVTSTPNISPSNVSSFEVIPQKRRKLTDCKEVAGGTIPTKCNLLCNLKTIKKKKAVKDISLIEMTSPDLNQTYTLTNDTDKPSFSKEAFQNLEEVQTSESSQSIKTQHEHTESYESGCELAYITKESNKKPKKLRPISNISCSSTISNISPRLNELFSIMLRPKSLRDIPSELEQVYADTTMDSLVTISVKHCEKLAQYGKQFLDKRLRQNNSVKLPQLVDPFGKVTRSELVSRAREPVIVATVDVSTNRPVKFELPAIKEELRTDSSNVKCDGNTSSCVSISPISSSKPSTDYNPFVTAERQLMELLECDDFQPFTPSNIINSTPRPQTTSNSTPTPKLTTKHTTSNKKPTAKSAKDTPTARRKLSTTDEHTTLPTIDNKPRGNAKRASVIDPPIEFNDKLHMLSDDFEMIENFINDAFNADNLDSLANLDSQFTDDDKCNKNFLQDYKYSDDNTIDPRLINENDNLDYPGELVETPATLTPETDSSIKDIVHSNFTVMEPLVLARTERVESPVTDSDLDALLKDLENDNSSESSRFPKSRFPGSAEKDDDTCSLHSSFGSTTSTNGGTDRMKKLSSLKRSISLLDPVAMPTKGALKNKQDVNEFLDQRQQQAHPQSKGDFITKEVSSPSPHSDDKKDELFSVDDDMYEEYKRYEQLYMQEKEEKRLNALNYTNEEELSAKKSGDSAYGSLNRKTPKVRTRITKLTPIDHHSHQHRQLNRTDSASSSGSDVSASKPSGGGGGGGGGLTTGAAVNTRMSRFCHECGNKFPISSAKFCVECGIKRLIL